MRRPSNADASGKIIIWALALSLEQHTVVILFWPVSVVPLTTRRNLSACAVRDAKTPRDCLLENRAHIFGRSVEAVARKLALCTDGMMRMASPSERHPYNTIVPAF